jgi:Ca2+-binding RTX toxin-like protein
MQPEMIQQLEERMFLSANGHEKHGGHHGHGHKVKTPKSSIVVKKHHVTLKGTKGDDVMSVVVNAADATKVDVTVNGETATISLEKIKRFKFDGRDGNDVMTMSADVFAFMDGGKGNDTMTVTGMKAAKMHGGKGNDVMTGGAGADKMVGGHGDDVMKGMAGDDKMVGNHGSDQMTGGEGLDAVAGGGGVDHFSASDDVLEIRDFVDGTDLIDLDVVVVPPVEPDPDPVVPDPDPVVPDPDPVVNEPDPVVTDPDPVEPEPVM